MRDLRLNPEVVLAQLRGLEKFQDLEPIDRLFLTMHAVARVAEKRLLPVNEALQSRHFGRCLTAAADALVRGRGISGARWLGATRRMCREFQRWHVWVLGVFDSLLKGAELNPRERQVFGLWWQSRCDLGIPRNWKQFKNAAGKAHYALEMPDGAEERTQTLALYRNATRGEPGGVFVKGEQMLLGHRQVRDTVGPLLGLKRKRRPPSGDWLHEELVEGDPMDDELRRVLGVTASKRRAHQVGLPEHEAGEDDLLEAFSAVDATDQDLAALDAVERARRTRDARESRLAEVEPGSPSYHVLVRLEALLSRPGDPGHLSLRQLEKDTGISKSELQRALASEMELIRRSA